MTLKFILGAGFSLGLGLAALAAGEAAAQTGETARVQAALEAWLAQRAPIEGVTGIAAYVSFGHPGPNIEAFAGTTGHDADDPPVEQNTLFPMGSTSKSFAAGGDPASSRPTGLLSLDDTVGEWLPQYPAWGDVSIQPPART